MTVSIEIKGLRKTRKFLNKKSNNITNSIPKGLTKASLHIQNEVKLSIAGRKPEPRSVDTGRFLNSVDKEVSKFNASVFSNIPYADKLELGTSKFKARHHFRNTEKREKRNIKKILGQEIKKSI